MIFLSLKSEYQLIVIMFEIRTSNIGIYILNKY